jgi:hypothetical protein
MIDKKASKPITLFICKCGNDTFRQFIAYHRWSLEDHIWYGSDVIHRCTKCGKEYYDEMDFKEHPDIDYWHREEMMEISMGIEEFTDYLSHHEDQI